VQNYFISHFFNNNLRSGLLISSITYFHQWRYKEQKFPIFSTLTLFCPYLFSSMKKQVLLHFHIFSTLTLSQLYLFSSMKIPSIFFILLGVKSLLTYFNYVCFISHFFHFNLKLVLPILINENTKNTHEIALFPITKIFYGGNFLNFLLFPISIAVI